MKRIDDCNRKTKAELLRKIPFVKMITLSKTTVKAIAPYNMKNAKKFENAEIV